MTEPVGCRWGRRHRRGQGCAAGPAGPPSAGMGGRLVRLASRWADPPPRSAPATGVPVSDMTVRHIYDSPVYRSPTLSASAEALSAEALSVEALSAEAGPGRRLRPVARGAAAPLGAAR
ncbi:hypothetical protein GCM10023176_59030 [Micromonospora coerulea]|uniref:Uncharacterized protein n=1 Tax=Micromonospora coerulea TaxID=47856 RepID=A0ABP8T5J8_9ACTN